VPSKKLTAYLSITPNPRSALIGMPIRVLEEQRARFAREIEPSTLLNPETARAIDGGDLLSLRRRHDIFRAEPRVASRRV
jgi:hypothetical protein